MLKCQKCPGLRYHSVRLYSLFTFFVCAFCCSTGHLPTHHQQNILAIAQKSSQARPNKKAALYKSMRGKRHSKSSNGHLFHVHTIICRAIPRHLMNFPRSSCAAWREEFVRPLFTTYHFISFCQRKWLCEIKPLSFAMAANYFRIVRKNSCKSPRPMCDFSPAR